MKRLLALLALFLPLYLFAQGFGSFSHDQPFLAKDTGSTTEQYLYFRYDANALGLNDGDLVSSFTDQGVYKHHLLGAITETPYWTNNAGEINNQGYVKFDGANDWLKTNATFVIPIPYHIFAVMELPTNGASKNIFTSYTNYDPCIFGAGMTLASGTFSAINGASITATDQFTNWTVFDICVNGVNSYVRTNNVLLKANPLGTNRWMGFQMGDSGGTLTANMKMAFCSLYTNALTESESDAIVTGLGTRFGLTTGIRNAVPTWNPTTNASLLVAYDLTAISATNREPLTKIPDLGPLHWDLTTTNGPTFLSGPFTNLGLGMVNFNTAGTANQFAFTNAIITNPQPTTVIAVGQYNNTAGGAKFFFDNSYGDGVDGPPQVVYANTSGIDKISAGTEVPVTTPHTAWTVFEVFYNGATSNLKTNNVSRGNINVGTGGRAGVVIAGQRTHDLSYEAYLNLSFFAIYTNALSVTERSNIYWYLGNKFSIPVTVP